MNCVIGYKLRKHRCDAILFLTIRRNGSLFFSLPLFNAKVAVMHHYDIDNMKRLKIDRFFFNHIKNKIYHIFLAEYIKKGTIEEYGINTDMTFVVHQPLKKTVTEGLEVRYRNSIFIGLGRNNDQEALNRLIEIDMNEVKMHKNKLIMQSRSINYYGKNLIISNKYLPQDAFDKHLCNSYACVVSYPQDYVLRYSGIIDDALAHGMIVFCNKSLMGEYFKHQYPNNVHLFNKIEDVYYYIISENMNVLDKQDYRKFLARHSDIYISKQFEKVFE